MPNWPRIAVILHFNDSKKENLVLSVFSFMRMKNDSIARFNGLVGKYYRLDDLKNFIYTLFANFYVIKRKFLPTRQNCE